MKKQFRSSSKQSKQKVVNTKVRTKKEKKKINKKVVLITFIFLFVIGLGTLIYFKFDEVKNIVSFIFEKEDKREEIINPQIEIYEKMSEGEEIQKEEEINIDEDIEEKPVWVEPPHLLEPAQEGPIERPAPIE